MVREGRRSKVSEAEENEGSSGLRRGKTHRKAAQGLGFSPECIQCEQGDGRARRGDQRRWPAGLRLQREKPPATFDD